MVETPTGTGGQGNMIPFAMTLRSYEEVRTNVNMNMWGEGDAEEIYDLHKKNYDRLTTKKFYSHRGEFFVAVEEYNAALKDLEDSLEYEKSIVEFIEDLSEDLDLLNYYKSEEGFEEFVDENSNINLFPSYLLKQEA